MAMGSAAIAQQSINDPARDEHYTGLKGRKVVFVPVFMGLDLTEGWSKMMAKQAEGAWIPVRSPELELQHRCGSTVDHLADFGKARRNRGAEP